MMQSMAVRKFAIDETSPGRGSSAKAIGEGQEPLKMRSTTLSRVRGLIGTPPWQTPAAASTETEGASAAYGTMTLEEIMADGIPEGTSPSKVCLQPFLHSLDLRWTRW